MFRSIISRNSYPGSRLILARLYSKGPAPDFSSLTKVIQDNGNKSSSSSFSSSLQTPSNMSTVEHVNSLLGGSSDQPVYHSISTRDTFLSAEARHPREVAKDMRIRRPNAGMTVNVPGHNVGQASNMIRALTRDNKIRVLQRVQARFIRPAKYQKQKKRDWWRRRFSEGFKGIMAQVKDAKRRGY